MTLDQINRIDARVQKLNVKYKNQNLFYRLDSGNKYYKVFIGSNFYPVMEFYLDSNLCSVAILRSLNPCLLREYKRNTKGYFHHYEFMGKDLGQRGGLNEDEEKDFSNILHIVLDNISSSNNVISFQNPDKPGYSQLINAGFKEVIKLDTQYGRAKNALMLFNKEEDSEKYGISKDTAKINIEIIKGFLK